ncbi:hypothetical protein PENTCL1PPCAC_29275, partial [Pristionchus entomophagus]
GKLRILITPSGTEANGSCPHFPQFAPSINCPYPGWCLEIIDVLVRSGNIPHEFVVDRNASGYIDIGRLQDNGTFSGILGRVESGEVDLACIFLQKSMLRLQYFDYSVAVSQIRPVFIVREITETIWSLLLNCLLSYDSGVWIGMLVAVITQMLVTTLIGRTETNSGVRETRANGKFFSWDVFDEMFNGGDHPFYFISGKLARLIFSIFQIGLLHGMYTSLLLTALVTPADSQADAVRLIESGRYKLVSDKSRWFAQEVDASSDPIFTQFREATKHNPIVDAISDKHALDLVSQGGYIYQTQNDEGIMAEEARKCYTFVFTRGLPFRSAHFLVRKGSPWLADLNDDIMRNYPMIDQRQLLNVRPNCAKSQFATPGPSDPLNFWSVSGIFMLASCGLIIATVALIIEYIVS